jgi:two-component system OmpR family sensor kinase
VIKDWRRAARTPFALQVVALLLLTLLAAQLMTVALLLLLPPPRPTFYHPSEVADQLAGRPAAAADRSFGDQPKLIRSLEPAARFDGKAVAEGSQAGRKQLALLLKVSPDRVYLQEAGPPFPYSLRRDDRKRVMERRDRPRPPPAGGPAFIGPGAPGGPGRFPGPGVGGGPSVGRGPGFGPDGFGQPLVGAFTAAVRQTDGQWVTVRPPPEGFPNAWQKRILIWLAGSMLLISPIGYLFARRMTAPLRAFAQAAERLGRDPQAPPMNLSGPAEIGVAAQAFNEMQGRLTRYVEDRTAMVGAISHDMRTPLARMRFKLEAAPPEVKAQVLADVEQMETMITAVLSFIRDASETRDRRRLDLLSVLEVAVDDVSLMGGDAEVEDGRPLIVEADALALQRLFTNLIGNAVKYGGQARIRLFEDGGDAVTQISDAGPGLAEGDLERVFAPFYRADAARTLDGGVGLGLAVARSIARAHGGDVSLANGAGGLIATVRLPMPRSE